jgi:hypothetical protein
MNYLRITCAVLMIGFWLGAGLGLVACSPFRPPEGPGTPAIPVAPGTGSSGITPKPAPKPTGDAEADAKALRDRLAEVEAEAEALRSKIKSADKEIEEAKKTFIRKILNWIAGICTLLAFGSFIASFFIPVALVGLRNWLRLGAAGFGSAVVLAMFASWLLPYMIYVYIALALGFAAVIITNFRRLVTAVKSAASYGDAAEKIDPTDKDALNKLKKEHRGQQAYEKVAGLLDRVRGKV